MEPHYKACCQSALLLVEGIGCSVQLSGACYLLSHVFVVRNMCSGLSHSIRSLLWSLVS